MMSVSKLGRLALSKLAKKLDAVVDYRVDVLPLEKTFKTEKCTGTSFFSYRVFLWDWEFGLVSLNSVYKQPLGIVIKNALTEKDSGLRIDTPRVSHVAIYSCVCHNLGILFPLEGKTLAVYRFDLIKFNNWLATNQELIENDKD